MYSIKLIQSRLLRLWDDQQEEDTDCLYNSGHVTAITLHRDNRLCNLHLVHGSARSVWHLSATMLVVNIDTV